MTWGPIRSGLIAGVLFGSLVLVVGTVWFLQNQGIIQIRTFDLWTLCSLSLVLIGVVIIGGTLWARGMMRGGWRKWAEPWERGWDSERDEPGEKKL